MVRPRFLFWGATAEAIEHAPWQEMEEHFEREMLRGKASRGDTTARRRLSGESEDKTIRCPECGKGFATAQSRDEHWTTKHTV